MPKGLFCVESVIIEDLGNLPVKIVLASFGLQDENVKTYSIDHIIIGGQSS